MGAFVAKGLVDPTPYIGQRIELASDAPTPAQMAELLSAALGRPVRHEQTPLESIRNPDMHAMWTFLNGPAIIGAGALTPDRGAGWRLGGFGDFNGDGYADLFWRNQTTGANEIWLMNDTARTSTVVLAPVSDLNWYVAATAVPPCADTSAHRFSAGPGDAA